MRQQGLVTVVLTAVVYSVSNLPMIVYKFAGLSVPGDNELFHVYFYRVAGTAVYFNVMCNFFIYSCTVASFRNFLTARIQMIRQYVFLCVPRSGESLIKPYAAGKSLIQN